MKITVLGSEAVHRIDQTARKVLDKVGVDIPHEEMRLLFRRAGAQIDASGERVRIPTTLIDECLMTAGKTFTVYGRDRSKTAAFGFGLRNYNSTAGQAYWIENDRRFSELDHVIRAAKIGDVLPHLSIVGAMADPHELHPAGRSVQVAAALLRTTTKPIMFWFYDRPSSALVIELLTAVAGSSNELAKFPLAYPFLEPISPLRFPKLGIDVLLETCKVPLPVPVGPMAQVGLTGPASLAGTLVQETAEILAGVCITQLIRPGTPVCFGGIPHAFDMRTSQMIFSGPEQALMAVAMTEMGKYYGLPVYINVGLTDSKCIDAQAGLEIGATLLAGALAGADIFGHLGIIGVDQGASLEMLLFQHEVIEYVERMMRGVTVDEETLALEVIERVGPGGNYITDEHTMRFFREEVWMPNLLDRDFWENWERKGKKSIAERLREQVSSCLARHQPQPLDEKLNREIERLINCARALEPIR